MILNYTFNRRIFLKIVQIYDYFNFYLHFLYGLFENRSQLLITLIICLKFVLIRFFLNILIVKY